MTVKPLKPLLLAATLLGAALALVPAASADPACTTDLCGPDPSQPPSCHAKGIDTYDLTVTVGEDCSVQVETGQDDLCVGAWYGVAEYDVGPVHWTRHYCTFPGGDPLCCLSSASDASAQQIPPCQCYPAPLCEPINELIAPGDGPVTYTLSNQCAATVTVDVTKVADCVYGTHKTVSAGPVTATVPVCTGPPCEACPPPTEFASTAPNYCGVKEQTPAPLAFVWGSDCYVDVDPIGACAPPSGFVIDRLVGPVHLHLLVCDGGAGGLLDRILESVGPVQS
jgi:hypothetical protein